VHQEVRMNFLASPPLVVAYALAGTVDIDLTRDPLGRDAAGKPCTCAMSGRQPSRCSSSSPRASMPRCSRRLTPMSSMATNAGAGSRLRHRRPTSGTAAALTSRIRLTSRAWARSRPAFRPCAARDASPCSATRSPRTTSRPRAPSGRMRRPASTCSHTASCPPTSTATARAAAITK
jgi:hypothetical protein